MLGLILYLEPPRITTTMLGLILYLEPPRATTTMLSCSGPWRLQV
jgi:hypothetical protein